MPDFKKMTVQSLRELARKVIGPGHTRLKTKSELVSALEQAEAQPAKEAPGSRVRAAASRAAEATGKAVRAAKAAASKAAGQAGKAASGRAAKVAAAGGAAAGVVAGAKAAARTGAKSAGPKKSGPKKSKVAKAAEIVAGALGAAAGAAAGLRRKGKAGAAAKSAGAERRAPPGGPDPEGYFVARVRGESAVREAPHPMREDAEDTAFEEAAQPPTPFDEGLGDLPWGYGDDAFVALPRDPRSIYLYWDHDGETVKGGFGGLEQARAQLWLFARSGAGWERIRVLEFALESRGYYLHDLEPGRVYRAEIHAVDRHGRERLVGRPSNEIGLPPRGPSAVIDDRFIRLPWDVPLGRLLGPGHAGGPFSDEARAMLSRLSDWSRFTTKAVWGGSAGAPGERPSSPTSAPSSPSSPAGPSGSGDR